MKVKEYLIGRMRERIIHMTLIDPAKQTPEKAGEMARIAESAGTDAFMVGGSTNITQQNLDASVLAIKDVTRLPVIYFPSGAHAISRYSDAIYFMSMLNSRDVKNVIGEQVAGAPIVKKLGIEPISMGYVIIEPGMKVGEIGNAELVPRNKPEIAVAYGLAAEYLGMDFLYLEAGSGAPEPVPEAMIRAVKSNVRIPVIVGGGIRTPGDSLMVKNAGANAIVTGTVIEEEDFGLRLGQIIKTLH
ncbi:MAG: geranylgeranylglyceryl/heptaprenylglyceryl phosphate synthase [Methanomassiliicoccales archaeon]|nr:geranylgeranylglyceryl/heptaprenylglyceryl phosphate synthase [Methanomassiliicoccales archaeon]